MKQGKKMKMYTLYSPYGASTGEKVFKQFGMSAKLEITTFGKPGTSNKAFVLSPNKRTVKLALEKYNLNNRNAPMDVL